MTKQLVFSVTLKDCDVQTFRSGGPGGQNQNKRNTGVRIIHRDSGARGESREQRSQLQNKKTAFRRMAESGKFKIWVNRELYYRGETPEAKTEKDMASQNLLIEGRSNGNWEPI